MKILADENMPAVVEHFAPFGEVITAPGREIDSHTLKGVDALLVRSVTRVDEGLLAGCRVRFVGSATIGTDHIDLDYLRREGIAFASAPGCNANAVADYMIAVFCACEPGWLTKTIAIVGCGNVGGRLYRRLRALGVRCLCVDPWLDRDRIPDLVPLEQALAADILCLHTPLVRQGPHPTRHLFDRHRLAALRPGALLVNAGRGAVVDNAALRDRLDAGQLLRPVLDVWENEPAIDTGLLTKVVLATPHIAGYSREGKLAGTRLVQEAFCRWLGRPVPAQPVCGQHRQIRLGQGDGLAEAVLAAYDPRADHGRMMAAMASGPPERVFDHLRRHYPERLEFSQFEVTGALEPALRRQLAALGFVVEAQSVGE